MTVAATSVLLLFLLLVGLAWVKRTYFLDVNYYTAASLLANNIHETGHLPANWEEFIASVNKQGHSTFGWTTELPKRFRMIQCATNAPVPIRIEAIAPKYENQAKAMNIILSGALAPVTGEVVHGSQRGPYHEASQ